MKFMSNARPKFVHPDGEEFIAVVGFNECSDKFRADPYMKLCEEDGTITVFEGAPTEKVEETAAKAGDAGKTKKEKAQATKIDAADSGDGSANEGEAVEGGSDAVETAKGNE